MGSIRLNICGSSNITLLSNDFIDNYMKDANDVQIKLYIYLLRNSSDGRSIDIAELADYFNYTEKDVIRALKYWEKKGVISLGDTLAETSAAEKKTPSAEKKPLPAFPDPDVVKAAYTIDMLKDFKRSPETSWLITALQQYTGRPVGPSRISSLLFMSSTLGMKNDLIDYLMQYCVERGDESIHNMEETALFWIENGVESVEQAKALCNSVSDADIKYVMRLLGRNSEPTEPELKLINRWIRTYGFDMEIIEEACNRAVSAVGSNRPAYAESILKQWFEKNVHTMEDVKICDEAFINSRAVKTVSSCAATSSVSSDKRSTFCDIEQQDYDFDELAGRLVNNN